MSTIAITGANIGCGYNCAVQLAKEPTTKKIIIVCRSQAKCDAAIASLKEETKKGDDFFGTASCDLADLAQIKACADNFPDFDRICLNAGGVTPNIKLEEADATMCMTINTLGHAALIDAMIANGKLCKGKQVL
jgi:NAD(P)-dependent dehydrogenase (short-subunit alcohol dehydrogenase family)